MKEITLESGEVKYIMNQAMISTEQRDKEGIKNGIYRIKLLNLTGGSISFNKKGSAPKEEGVMKVVDGSSVVVKE